MPIVIYCTSGIVRPRTIRLWYILSRCWHHCHAGIYYQCYGNNHTTPSVFFARSTRYQCTMQVFSNSLLIHLAVGLLLPLLLFLFQDYLCTSFFNIPDIRRNAAADVYLLMLGILFLTFLSAPFKAALISHENIVYISIVEIMDGVFKLALAIVLLQLRSDKLVTYTIILLFIYLLNFRLFVFCGVALQGMSSFKDYCRLRQASDCRIGKFHQVDYLRYGSSSNTNTGIVNIT